MGDTTRTTKPTAAAFVGAGRKVPAPTISDATALKMLGGFNFKSIQEVQKGLMDAKFKAGHVAPCLGGAFAQSEQKALLLSKAILRREVPLKQSEDEARTMIHWAKDAGPKQRQLVCSAFHQSKMGPMLVHGIAEMAKDDASKYMKDFFDSGGEMKDVMAWLEVAGGVMRKLGPMNEDTQGVVTDAVKWVGGKIEDAAVAAGDMVSTVVHATISAGKSLADMVGHAATWSADRVADLARSLLAAGKALGGLLEEGLKHGVALLEKFVQGVVKAGKAVADVVAWAISKSASVLTTTIEAILKAGRTVAALVASVIKKGTRLIAETVKTLAKIGKQTVEILHGIVGATLQAAKDVVQALIQAGRAVGEILSEACSKLIPSVLEPVIRGLIQLGKGVRDILVAAVGKSIQLAQDVARTLIHVGQKLGDVLRSAVTQTVDVLSAVMRGILAAGKKVGEVVAEALAFTGAQIKQVVMALVKAGAKVGEILVGFVKSTASAIRTGLEGLFEIGVHLGEAVVSICKDVAEGFRKGFFEGLLALGKGALDILKEALKAGAAVLALSFAVFMEIWGGYRALEEDEKREARKVFGWSIDLDRVKIAHANIPADVVNWLNHERAFTTMYCINFSSKVKKDENWMHNLIHELTHVWQGVVAGPIYMVEALHSQLFGRKYKVEDSDLQKAKGDFNKLEREQQATVVEWYWWGKWGGSTTIQWQTYEPLAKQVYAERPAGALMTNPQVPTIRLVQPQVIRVNG